MRGIVIGAGLVAAAVLLTAQYNPNVLGAPAFSGSSMMVTMADGTVVSVPTGYSISGSLTHAGRTTTPVVVSYTAVALGGTAATAAASDPKTGNAQIGDSCSVASATATPLPSTMRFQCDITSAGVATITAFPTLGIALGAQSVSVNVFWRG
jgi:hypothetical protein